MTPEERVRAAADACRATKDPFTYRFAACERHFADAIRAALRERDAEWAAALRLSHYDSIDGPHMAYTTPAGEWLGCNECAPLCALLEEAGK